MLLRELLLKEDDRSTAVFAFGRFNPPTIGHQKLIDTVTSTAEKANAKPYLFLSHKQNNKTDPLTFAEKQAYIQQYYPKLQVGDANSNTIIKALQKIQSEGRTRIIMIAGSDRVEEFEKLLNQYNGKPDKQGNLLYQFDDIRVMNAGQRDPDAEGVSGASASKARELAAKGQEHEFS
jgi:phosphopantetheine adenylyltransferase